MIAELTTSTSERFSRVADPADLPTVWGLDPVQLHDRFWAARGVYVVRPGELRELPADAEVFMLTDSQTLAVFAIRQIVEWMYWVKPAVMFVRLRSRRGQEYRERVVTGTDGRFVRFERDYGHGQGHTARVVLTRDPKVAGIWQTTDGSADAWRQFRYQTRSVRTEICRLQGRYYSRNIPSDLDALVMDLMHWWRQPSATIEHVEEPRPHVWVGPDTQLDPSVRFLGSAWIGAGRTVPAQTTVVGPAVLWDDPACRPRPAEMQWQQIEPTHWQATGRPAPTSSAVRRISKRAFDIVFAVGVLAGTLPLYPLIMLAIWLEDGRPFLFAHKRETVGGREFGCLKFRSMRKDADQIRAMLVKQNQSDGPQFFIDNDPRITRVGRFLRKHNLDELPQFFNVLLADMSVVGPRPSPRAENQFSPGWREARLSVRPGITGLWQVSRTRRPGLDFQEWVKYDIEYVEKSSWRLDLKIILKTIWVLLGS